MKDLWTVIHTHRHGTTVYTVKCKHEPSEDEVVAGCDIDFEPEWEEFIDIQRVDEIISIK